MEQANGGIGRWPMICDGSSAGSRCHIQKGATTTAYLAASITPQAIRAPELPAGSDFRSSSFSCTTTDLPIMESAPLNDSLPFHCTCALPDASASMLPKSPL